MTIYRYGVLFSRRSPGMITSLSRIHPPDISVVISHVWKKRLFYRGHFVFIHMPLRRSQVTLPISLDSENYVPSTKIPDFNQGINPWAVYADRATERDNTTYLLTLNPNPPPHATEVRLGLCRSARLRHGKLRPHPLRPAPPHHSRRRRRRRDRKPGSRSHHHGHTAIARRHLIDTHGSIAHGGFEIRARFEIGVAG